MSSDSTRDRILAAAWAAFMEHGFADATTLDIASRARVSKRELYALVGNKEQMLAACIASRGRRMRLPDDYPEPADRPGLHAALRQYGATLLTELMNENVLATFRLGIAEVKRSPAIARSINTLGREPARARLAELLKAARASGLIAEGDIARMMDHYRGLLWGERMVWILLGLEKPPGTKEIERHADEVAGLFLTLYGRGKR